MTPMGHRSRQGIALFSVRIEFGEGQVSLALSGRSAQELYEEIYRARAGFRWLLLSGGQL
jgi:hypothetical protein